MSKYINFGNRLSRLRESSNLTQTDLAKLAGISRQSIYNYESGKIIPKTDIIAKLAKVLKVSVEYLYKGELDFKDNKHMTYKEAIVNYLRLKDSNIFTEEIVQTKNNKTKLVITTTDSDFINFVSQLNAVLLIEDSISSDTLNSAIKELLDSYEIAILPSDKTPFKK